jgi:hypothetical protein
MTTLPLLAEKYGITSVDFIKMDIEGYEPAVLKDSFDFITRHQILVLFEFNSLNQLIFGDFNPWHFLSWISSNFAYVYVSSFPGIAAMKKRVDIHTYA